MQSLVLTKSGLQLADTPMPSLKPGDVRIEVRSVGICGTDLAIWRGDFEVKLPIILGHEITGVIHESSIPGIEIGTLVTTEVDISCGRCWFCEKGLKHLCVTKETIGITTDGGLSEYLSVPAELVYPLPEGVDAISGVFVEPLASAIETYDRFPIPSNEPVLIIGSGKLGLLLAQVYDALGAEVYVAGHNRIQLGLVRRLGLMNTIDTTDKKWKKRILDITSGVGPRLVIEATGNSDGIRLALEIVRSGGVVAIKSMHGRAIEINPTVIVDREITLFGTSRGDYKKAIEMLDKGRIEVKDLISKEFRLEDGAMAFEYASQPGVTKVIVNI